MYEGDRRNIVGVLFVKSLIMLDPDDAIPITDVYKAGSFLKSSTTEPLFELLDNFQSGKSKGFFCSFTSSGKNSLRYFGPHLWSKLDYK